MANKKTVEEKKFVLPKGIITVKPVIKSTYLIPDTNHRAAFLAPGAKREYTVPILRNGQYANVLTDEEKDFFESPESGLDLSPGDLSIYKRVNNFWDTFKIQLGKDELTLDKSNPFQYLEYKVLLANNEEVAPSLEELRSKRKATYKYVLVDAQQEASLSSKEADLEETAWSLYGELKNDRVRMLDILGIFGRKLTTDSTDDMIRSNIKNIMKDDLREFVTIANDSNLDVKIFITKCVSAGLIQKRANIYSIPGGEKIGNTLFEAAEYLKKPENQEILLSLEARLND